MSSLRAQIVNEPATWLRERRPTRACCRRVRALRAPTRGRSPGRSSKALLERGGRSGGLQLQPPGAITPARNSRSGKHGPGDALERSHGIFTLTMGRADETPRLGYPSIQVRLRRRALRRSPASGEPSPRRSPVPRRPLTSAVTAATFKPVHCAVSPFSHMRSRFRTCDLVRPSACSFTQARAAEPDAERARPMRSELAEGRACSPGGEPARPRVSEFRRFCVWGWSDGELAPRTLSELARWRAGSPDAERACPTASGLPRRGARSADAVRHPPMAMRLADGELAHPPASQLARG
jgi:hypothetical protein